MQQYSIVAVSEIEPGDHLCILYETEQQHQELLTSYISSGLEQGQKVVYIVDSHTADVILEYLVKVGLDPASYLDSGQLSILSVESSYLREGSFDPDAMIDLLRREERQALEEGYSALRVTGEMTWVLRGQPGSERLIEYEAKLNVYFPGSRALALCQYDRWAFDTRLLLDVISTHPIVVIGTEAYDNFYYMPPGEFLGEDDPTSTLNQRIGHLKTRKRLERSWRDSEKLYRSIFNSGSDGIYVYRLNEEMEPGEFLEVNDGACAMLGYGREKLIKMNRMDLLAPERLEDFRDTYLERLLTEEKILYQTVMVARNGRRVPVEISSHLIELDGQRVVMAIDRDITARLQAEEDLRASEERFSKVFEANPLAICITVVPEGRLVDANQAYVRLTGYAREELIGRTTVELGLSPSLEDREQVVKGLMDHGGFRDVDVQVRGKSGDIHDLSASSVVIELEGEKCAVTMLEPRGNRQARWGLEP